MAVRVISGPDKHGCVVFGGVLKRTSHSLAEAGCSSSDSELRHVAAAKHAVFDEPRMLEVEHVVWRQQNNGLTNGMYVRAWW